MRRSCRLLSSAGRFCATPRPQTHARAGATATTPAPAFRVGRPNVPQYGSSDVSRRDATQARDAYRCYSQGAGAHVRHPPIPDLDPAAPPSSGAVVVAFEDRHPDFLTVHLADDNHAADTRVHLSKLWLRDVCACPKCVDTSSGQKKFETCDIPWAVSVRDVTIGPDGNSLEISWADSFLVGDNSHKSVYPASLLQRAVSPSRAAPDEVVKHTTWDRASFESQARFIPYAEWIKGSGDVFWSGFLDLARLGLVFIKDVPESQTAVEDLANAIGHAQTTFYGKTWDVISKPQAENVAYTNVFLCLHQDLLYMKDPPRLQLLHCLANSFDGGESLFSDGIRAAEEIRDTDPAGFALLRDTPVHYHYDKNGHFYRHSRPVVTMEKGGSGDAIDSIGWAPPFQDNFPPPAVERLDMSTRDPLEKWRAAAQKFRDSTRAPENMFEYKMNPGECVIFDNMRVLHGRREFSLASGMRWLKGTYVQEQVMRSKLAQIPSHLRPRSS